MGSISSRKAWTGNFVISKYRDLSNWSFFLVLVEGCPPRGWSGAGVEVGMLWGDGDSLTLSTLANNFSQCEKTRKSFSLVWPAWSCCLLVTNSGWDVLFAKVVLRRFYVDFCCLPEALEAVFVWLVLPWRRASKLMDFHGEPGPMLNRWWSISWYGAPSVKGNLRTQ